MAGTTTNFAWPFPTNGDVPNVAADIQSLAAAVDGTLGNAFTAYTPAWTATGVAPVVNNGTITGRFKRFGKWGLNSITLTIGTTTTVGTLLYRWSLPAGWTLQNATSIYGVASVFDLSTTTTFVGTVSAASTTLVTIRTHNAATEASATVPVAPATGDVYNLLMVAELA
jgi:hypothetical protein